MLHKVENRNILILLILALAWGAALFLPWAVWLTAFPWLRMIITLVIFILPGMGFSVILVRQNFTLLSHFTNGLAVSMFIVGLLGLLGRIFNLPFAYIKPLFALSGLFVLFILFKYSQLRYELYARRTYPIVILISLITIVFLSVLGTDVGFGGDNIHYLPYLTSWQHAQPLNFQSVFTGLPEYDRVRFWMEMFPMNLAFISDISKLHGILLLGLYFQPVCTILAIIAIYNLYEHILESDYQAIIALFAQFIFLLLFRHSFQFGTMFFGRLAEDKGFAAFILAPIFFSAAVHFGRSFSVRSGWLLFLIGSTLGLTHPIILAYSIFIVGAYLCILILTQRKFKELLIVAVVLAAILLPPAMLRVVGIPWVSFNILRFEEPVKQAGTFDLEIAKRRPDLGVRVTYIEGTPFYGFNTDVVKIKKYKVSQPFLLWIYPYFVVAGFIWSLFNLKKKEVAPFITASSLLILVCGIPYTGWLMGYLVTVRMLWRAPWVMQIGLVAYVLLYEIVIFVGSKFKFASKFSGETVARNVLVMVCCVGVIWFSFLPHSLSFSKWRPETINGLKGFLEKWAELGTYLENNVDKPSRFASESSRTLNFLPGISSKAKVVYFGSGGVRDGDIGLRERNPILVANDSVSIGARIGIMQKNKIKYIITYNILLKDYYASHAQHFSIDEFKGFWIIKFNSKNPW